MQQSIIDMIDESIKTKQLLKSEADGIARAVEAIITSFRNGGKLITFGNGGSAADSQHIAAEFVGRYFLERLALPAIALSVNTSSLTSIANDYGYEHVFERQVNALCKSNDVVIGISTSGKSRNVISAIEAAKTQKAVTIALTGKLPNKLAEIADISISVSSSSTPRIQECHILIGHIMTELVERAIHG